MRHEELARQARPLGDLAGGEALAAAVEHALDRQQREPVLVDRASQLLERDSVVGELGEQPQPCLACLAARPLEQPLGIEIDLGHVVADSASYNPCMADMDADAVELPIFELPLVLLPGELVPLHIFEERYKRMIAHCLEDGEPFGIVFRDGEGGARRVGCEARVTEVTERFDDGRLNIIVTGERPFRDPRPLRGPRVPRRRGRARRSGRPHAAG